MHNRSVEYATSLTELSVLVWIHIRIYLIKYMWETYEWGADIPKFRSAACPTIKCRTHTTIGAKWTREKRTKDYTYRAHNVVPVECTRAVRCPGAIAFVFIVAERNVTRNRGTSWERHIERVKRLTPKKYCAVWKIPVACTRQHPSVVGHRLNTRTSICRTGRSFVVSNPIWSVRMALHSLVRLYVLINNNLHLTIGHKLWTLSAVYIACSYPRLFGTFHAFMALFHA